MTKVEVLLKELEAKAQEKDAEKNGGGVMNVIELAKATGIPQNSIAALLSTAAKDGRVVGCKVFNPGNGREIMSYRIGSGVQPKTERRAYVPPVVARRDCGPAVPSNFAMPASAVRSVAAEPVAVQSQPEEVEPSARSAEPVQPVAAPKYAVLAGVQLFNSRAEAIAAAERELDGKTLREIADLGEMVLVSIMPVGALKVGLHQSEA